MEARELMIGDWVYCNGNIVVIESINPDSKQYISGGKLFSYIYNDGIYEPIHLTEEILKANGFEYHKGEWTLLRKGYLFSLTAFVEDGYCTGGFGTQIIINYVHELQHALRLCGLTELADNFKV